MVAVVLNVVEQVKTFVQIKDTVPPREHESFVTVNVLGKVVVGTIPVHRTVKLADTHIGDVVVVTVIKHI